MVFLKIVNQGLNFYQQAVKSTTDELALVKSPVSDDDFDHILNGIEQESRR